MEGWQLDLTSSDLSPIPRTRPEYSGRSIALAYASSGAHRIDPYGASELVLVVSSAINSLNLSYIILNLLIKQLLNIDVLSYA